MTGRPGLAAYTCCEEWGWFREQEQEMQCVRAWYLLSAVSLSLRRHLGPVRGRKQFYMQCTAILQSIYCVWEPADALALSW